MKLDPGNQANMTLSTFQRRRTGHQNRLYRYFIGMAVGSITFVSLSQIRLSAKILRVGHSMQETKSLHNNHKNNEPRLVPGLKLWKNEALDRSQQRHLQMIRLHLSKSQELNSLDEHTDKNSTQPEKQNQDDRDDDRDMEIELNLELELELEMESSRKDPESIEERQNPNSNTQQQNKSLQFGRPKATINYAITVTECSPTNLHSIIYPAAVLAHSIQRMSMRRNHTQTRYDSALYALVHEDAANHCNAPLYSLGYTVVNGQSPQQSWEQPNPKEYMKLYALSLSHQQLVVAMDVDTVLLQPLDALFDLLLERVIPSDTLLTSHSHIQQDLQNYQQIAFLSPATMNSKPYSKIGHSSFFVAQTSNQAYDTLLQRIPQFPNQTLNQFLSSVFFDKSQPVVGLELNPCRFFTSSTNCPTTKFDKVHVAHFELCGAVPWSCPLLSDLAAAAANNANICLPLFRSWHEIRQEMDHMMIIGGDSELTGTARRFLSNALPNTFGYCSTEHVFVPIEIPQYVTMHDV